MRMYLSFIIEKKMQLVFLLTALAATLSRSLAAWSCRYSATMYFNKCLLRKNVSNSLLFESFFNGSMVEKVCRQMPKIYRCYRHLKNCPPALKRDRIFRFNIKNFRLGYRELCSQINDFLRGLPCYAKLNIGFFQHHTHYNHETACWLTKEQIRKEYNKVRGCGYTFAKILSDLRCGVLPKRCSKTSCKIRIGGKDKSPNSRNKMVNGAEMTSEYTAARIDLLFAKSVLIFSILQQS